MATLRYDEEATRRLVAVYVTPDVVAQRERVLQALQPRPGERILDVGSGPGMLVESIAAILGASGFAAGVDISERLLDYANAHRANPDRVEFRRGDATALPYADAGFDAAVCTQVLEYVDDADAAVGELHRVVRSGGRVVVLDTDWDSMVWYSPNEQRMNRILAAWDGHAPHPRLPRTLGARLRRAGFRVDVQQVLALFNPSWDEDSYSGRMIDLIEAYVVEHGIAAGDARAWAQELRSSGERGQYFFSLNRYLFVATRPEAAAAAALKRGPAVC